MHGTRPLARSARRRLGCAAVAALLLAACGSRDPLERARELQAGQDFAGSLEILEQLVTERPGDPEIHYLHGLALVRTGQPSLAIWSLRRAMEDPKWLAPAARELAGSATLTGNPDTAVEAMTRVLEQEPDNLDALVLRAKAQVATRRAYAGALEDAERVVARDPDHVDGLVMRTVALLMLGRADEAEKALEDLEARSIDVDLGLDLGANFCLARALFAEAKEQWEEAQQLFEKCLASFPSDNAIATEVVRFFDEREQPERSIEILRQLVELDPLASAARVSLAMRYEASGRGDEALKLLEDGTQVRDVELASVAFVDIGDLYASRGDYAASAEALGKAIEKSRDPRPELLFQYADTLVMAGQPAKARELASKFSVPAHRELLEARALMSEGRLEESLARFDAGLRMWPDNAVAHYYAARVAERLGNFDRAVDEYRYSIRSGLGASNARLRLARLHEAERSFEEAISVARHGTATVPADPEAERVALRIAARIDRLADFEPLLRWHAGQPAHRGAAVAAMAQGVRERSGPAEASRFVRENTPLDLSDPSNAEALRELVLSLSAAGDAKAAVAAVDAALAAHPDAAVFHELRGLALASSGADAAAVRAAYERALALDAQHTPALLGLARLAAARGENDEALTLFARAAESQQDVELGDPEPWRAWAELLVALGRKDEAAQRLEALLEHAPYDAAAALRLSGLRAEQPEGVEQALELARRAVRFGGGAAAYDQLAQLHRLRGETEKAAAAQARAKQARARQRKPADAPTS
jgi:tetratricopeptide (TPR) repeat protein